MGGRLRRARGAIFETAALARAAGQAAAVPHMGAHALGAAAYAARAAGLAAPDTTDAVWTEVRWQLDHMPAPVRVALRQLPPVGQDASGPLGPGLLANGLLGEIVSALQGSCVSVEHDAATTEGR